MDDKRLEQLEQDLVGLRKDFAAISATLEELAGTRQQSTPGIRRAREKAHTLWRDIQERGPGYYACARARFNDRLNQARDRIRARPGGAAALFTVVGFLIGFLIYH